MLNQACLKVSTLQLKNNELQDWRANPSLDGW